MWKRHTLLAFVLASVGLTSCDVLEEQAASEVTAETHYTTPAGFLDAVNAAYEPMRTYYGQEQGGNLTVMGTDIITNGGHGGFHYMNQYTADLNSESSPFWNLWSNFYVGINTANAAVDRASELGEDADMTAEEINARVGEARFLRAHYYFTLVQQFGSVHLTLEETQEVITEAERAPEDVIYNAIVEDLEFAIEHLPATQDEFGRATEPAAKHMLALVLLTRGHRDFAQSDDFSRAATLAEEVINNYDHRLLDDFEDVFDHDNEQNAEVLWSIQYVQDPLLNGPGNQSHVHYRPWYEVYNDGLERALEPGYGRPWIRFRPTGWALNNYRPLEVDSRFDKTFQTVWYYNSENGLPEGAAVGDTAIWITEQELTQAKVDEIESRLPGVAVFSWNLSHRDDDVYWSMYAPDNINIFPSLKKVDDFKRPSVNELAGSRDYIVYRLAETYLLAAEALLMDGRPEEAVEYVNAVRRRAAYPGEEDQMEVNAGAINIDFLLDERARELYGEQKRWLDLKRTGRLLERVQKYNPQAAPNIDEHHLLRPIPAQQLNRTTSAFSQNPGY